jgi:Mn2+/Fe2+ NRAMP family transporter
VSDTQVGRAGTAPTVPTNFLEYLKALGPGIVVGLAWLGTGDVIDNSVAGANYGYALLWVLPLSLTFRFLFVSQLAKYPLFNVHGDQSILDGFGRIHKVFGWIFVIALLIYGHTLLAFTLSGVGTTLFHMMGESLNRFVWAVVGVATIFIVTRTGSYILIERIFKVILGVMGAAFLLGIVLVGISWGEFFSGLVFSLPPRTGVFASSLIFASLLLATVGSIANIFYPEFMQEKGWTSPSYRKVQMYDLLFGVVVVALLGLAVWAVAAEVLFGGPPVETAEEIAQGLAGAIGPIGFWIFFVGLFAAAWTTAAGSTFAIAKMVVRSLRINRPERVERYGEAPERDPVYLVALVVVLAAVLWSLPWAPSFVWLTVVLHALQSPFLVLLVFSLILLLNRRALLGNYVNRWWENAILAVLGVLTLVAGYQGIKEAITLIGELL